MMPPAFFLCILIGFPQYCESISQTYTFQPKKHSITTVLLPPGSYLHQVKEVFELEGISKTDPKR